MVIRAWGKSQSLILYAVEWKSQNTYRPVLGMVAALLIASHKCDGFLTSLRKPDVRSKPVSMPLGNQFLGLFQNAQ